MSFDPITAGLNLATDLIDHLWPDPAQRDAAKLKLLEMNQSGELAKLSSFTDLMKAQLAVNTAEASNPNLWVAGWRPFIGWICGACLGFQFVGVPIIQWAATKQMPVIDYSGLSTILMGMLGLAGMRTYEKVKGTQTPEPGH